MTRRQALYFVGAGLPKSLQITGFPIPLMWDFVRILAHYAESDAVLLTTLTQLEAAGVFEHSTSESTALAKQIAPPKTSTPEERRRFLDLLASRPDENIEALLIRADEMARHAKRTARSLADRITIESLPQRFSFAINRLFNVVGWNFSERPLRMFLRQQMHGYHTCTFISFNYDLLLEHVLEEVGSDCWAASTGYGQQFAEYVEAEEANRHIEHFAQLGTGGAVGTLEPRPVRKTSSPRVKVLKPHGSLNWLCRFEGNYNFVGAPTHLSLSDDERVAYLSGSHVELLERPDAMPWPNVGVLISPPTRKVPMPHLLEQEREALMDADDVFVVGWSAPTTDENQLHLIREAVSHRSKPLRRLTIIDKNPASDQIRRLRQAFSASVVELWPFGFETYARFPLRHVAGRLCAWLSAK
jgi:hypothetical protein